MDKIFENQLTSYVQLFLYEIKLDDFIKKSIVNKYTSITNCCKNSYRFIKYY